MRVFIVACALATIGSSLDAQPNCKKGIPCGNSCIAANKVCRIGTQSTPSSTTPRSSQPAPLMATDRAGEFPALPAEMRRTGGTATAHIVEVEGGVVNNRELYDRAIRNLCWALSTDCSVAFFPSGSAPRGIPMPTSMRSVMLAEYSHTGRTGERMFRFLENGEPLR